MWNFHSIGSEALINGSFDERAKSTATRGKLVDDAAFVEEQKKRQQVFKEPTEFIEIFYAGKQISYRYCIVISLRNYYYIIL